MGFMHRTMACVVERLPGVVGAPCDNRVTIRPLGAVECSWLGHRSGASAPVVRSHYHVDHPDAQSHLFPSDDARAKAAEVSGVRPTVATAALSPSGT